MSINAEMVKRVKARIEDGSDVDPDDAEAMLDALEEVKEAIAQYQTSDLTNTERLITWSNIALSRIARAVGK